MPTNGDGDSSRLGNSELEELERAAAALGADWSKADFRDVENVKGCLIEGNGYARMALVGGARMSSNVLGEIGRVRKEHAEQADRDALILTELARIKDQGARTLSLQETLVVRSEWLTKIAEASVSPTRVRELEDALKLVREANDQREVFATKDRARLQRQITAIEKKAAEALGAARTSADDTGKKLDALTLRQAEEKLAEARASLAEVKADRKELAKEKRGGIRWWKQQRVIWLGAILLLCVGALVTAVVTPAIQRIFSAQHPTR